MKYKKCESDDLRKGHRMTVICTVIYIYIFINHEPKKQKNTVLLLWKNYIINAYRVQMSLKREII